MYLFSRGKSGKRLQGLGSAGCTLALRASEAAECGLQGGQTGCMLL